MITSQLENKMSYSPSSPELVSIKELLAKYPRRGILLFKLLEDIRGDCSPLGKEFAELIVKYITALNGQGYADTPNHAVSKLLATPKHDHRLSGGNFEKAESDRKLTSMLRFVKKLTLSPELISAADITRIFAAGWDEHAFLDAVFLCAVVNCMNRCVLGIGIDNKTTLGLEILN
jgi:hypothetical protein